MKIAIGSDHAGFLAKEELRKFLAAAGHEVVDLGTKDEQSVDYPDYAKLVAEQVAAGKAERGVLVCGTGIGMSITANRVAKVRAALVTDEFTAEMSRKHNDANVFCAGARVVATEKMKALLDLWLKTAFEGGRHARRVEKMS
jgi:ribose 5-phosphate isomerase B